MAIGVDVGTSNLLIARLVGDDKVNVSRLRNAFISVDDEQKQHLAKANINAVHIKNNTFVVGDEAIEYARILNKEIRRPMASGVLNPEEREGRAIITALVKTLVGEASEPGERCAFSVPAVALDNPKANTVWHTGFFSGLFEELGYAPEPINEALAIVYSDIGDDEDHCGIAISHGAGQVNVAASYKLIASLEFSIARSGDWIDTHSASSMGVSPAKILKVKENPSYDLMDPEALDDEIGPAIMYHYKAMIKYELTNLVAQWSKMKHQLEFPHPVPIVLSGGTASLKGFRELWVKELDLFQRRTPLPFEISEVRMARDPFGAVARGLLTYALS